MSRLPRKSSKDLTERLVKEPLYKIVKVGGVLQKTYVEPPPNLEDEDVFYNTLLRDVDTENFKASPPSGFGKFDSQKNSKNVTHPAPSIKKGETGFGKYMDRQQGEAFLNPSSPETAAIQQRIISNYAKQLEQSNPDYFPEGWRTNPRLRQAIAQIIAEDLHISIDEVMEKL